MVTEEVGVFLEQARQAALMGNKEAARMLLKNLMEYEPQHVDAWLLYADVAETPAQAVQCLVSVLEIEPDHGIAKSRLALLRAARKAAVQSVNNTAPPPQKKNKRASKPKPEPEPVLPGLKEKTEPQKPRQKLGMARLFLVSIALIAFFSCLFLTITGLHIAGLIHVPFLPGIRSGGQAVATETAAPVEAVAFSNAPDFYLPDTAELPAGYQLLGDYSGPFEISGSPGYVAVFQNPANAATGSAHFVTFKLVAFDSVEVAALYFSQLASAPVNEFVSSEGLELAAEEYTMPGFDQMQILAGVIPSEGGDSPAQLVRIMIFRQSNLTGYVMVSGAETEAGTGPLQAELEYFVSLVLENLQ